MDTTRDSHGRRRSLAQRTVLRAALSQHASVSVEDVRLALIANAPEQQPSRRSAEGKAAVPAANTPQPPSSAVDPKFGFRLSSPSSSPQLLPTNSKPICVVDRTRNRTRRDVFLAEGYRGALLQSWTREEVDALTTTLIREWELRERRTVEPAPTGLTRGRRPAVGGSPLAPGWKSAMARWKEALQAHSTEWDRSREKEAARTGRRLSSETEEDLRAIALCVCKMVWGVVTCVLIMTCIVLKAVIFVLKGTASILPRET
ncbi:hypothetical protein JCM6882_006402 [Rhodosporidiobolus microsporus]